jgi:hypothetical protein
MERAFGGFSSVEILGEMRKIKSVERVSFWESLLIGYSTPLPPTSESLAGRGVCKTCAQNLEPQWFRGQNLDPKRLMRGS